MDIVSNLLSFSKFKAIDSNNYNFMLLDSQAMTEPWDHQKRALENMDDPVRQSTRIVKVDDTYYWMGQDGYPTAMWIPKQRMPIPPPVPQQPAPLQSPKVTRLHAWSDAKMNVAVPHININGTFQPYTPEPRTVYAIIPGLNRVSHLMHAQDGVNFNLVLQKSWNPSYDHYAYRNPRGKNLRNLATLVLEDIKEMIQAGKGPAAIVCGSRGGQETMLELSKHWRGLVFDFNGGYLTGCQREYNTIPEGVQLVSVLGQLDFFYFAKRHPMSADNFKALVQSKLKFLTQCVGNQGKGEHMLYASSVIDHSLDELDGRSLILSVMQGGHGGIRREDSVYVVA